MINARCESVADKPAYRAAFRRRRCLVVADGFYEWQPAGRRKQPYFIHFRDDRPFAFAGLWESWEGADHSSIESCTLLTTTPNSLIAPIHDRMPVILAREHHDRWLDTSIEKPGALQPLLVPFPSDAMEAYPVSPHVNNPGRDDPACVQRVAD
jgi:putative SOS response-associated peptidase YedK